MLKAMGGAMKTTTVRKDGWKEFWEQSKSHAPADSELKHKQLQETYPSIVLSCDQNDRFRISASGLSLKILP